MLGVLILIFGLEALVLSPFAFFQIITKAGYSGWWTFVPYSPMDRRDPGRRACSATVDTSHRSIGYDRSSELWPVGSCSLLLTGCFVMIMFFIFAFSAWPSLQQGRLGPRQRSQPCWPQRPLMPAVVDQCAAARRNESA